MSRTGTRRWAVACALVSLTFLAAGCGDDDDTASGTVKVTGVDFAYDDLPEKAEPGTVLTLTNNSDVELHELVAFRLPETETRPVSELVKLPQDQLTTLLAGPPAMVLLAPPSGGAQIAAVGDGSLKDAGRYAVICSIPTGADPNAYLQAAQSGAEGPPQVAGGPPHFAQGMFGEIVVE
jgi:hypothetical protein